MEIALDCLRSWDFLIRLANTTFCGKVIQLKLSWKIMIGVH